VVVILVKEFGGMHLSWASFYAQTVMTLSGIGMMITLISALYFYDKARRSKATVALPAAA
jgi:hypothetical protein